MSKTYSMEMFKGFSVHIVRIGKAKRYDFSALASMVRKLPDLTGTCLCLEPKCRLNVRSGLTDLLTLASAITNLLDMSPDIRSRIVPAQRHWLDVRKIQLLALIELLDMVDTSQRYHHAWLMSRIASRSLVEVIRSTPMLIDIFVKSMNDTEVSLLINEMSGKLPKNIIIRDICADWTQRLNPQYEETKAHKNKT